MPTGNYWVLQAKDGTTAQYLIVDHPSYRGDQILYTRVAITPNGKRSNRWRRLALPDTDYTFNQIEGALKYGWKLLAHRMFPLTDRDLRDIDNEGKPTDLVELANAVLAEIPGVSELLSKG